VTYILNPNNLKRPLNSLCIIQSHTHIQNNHHLHPFKPLHTGTSFQFFQGGGTILTDFLGGGIKKTVCAKTQKITIFQNQGGQVPPPNDVPVYISSINNPGPSLAYTNTFFKSSLHSISVNTFLLHSWNKLNIFCFDIISHSHWPQRNCKYYIIYQL